jgi:hypothetical protein
MKDIVEKAWKELQMLQREESAKHRTVLSQPEASTSWKETQPAKKSRKATTQQSVGTKQFVVATVPSEMVIAVDRYGLKEQVQTRIKERCKTRQKLESVRQTHSRLQQQAEARWTATQNNVAQINCKRMTLQVFTCSSRSQRTGPTQLHQQALARRLLCPQSYAHFTSLVNDINSERMSEELRLKATREQKYIGKTHRIDEHKRAREERLLIAAEKNKQEYELRRQRHVEEYEKRKEEQTRRKQRYEAVLKHKGARNPQGSPMHVRSSLHLPESESRAADVLAGMEAPEPGRAG